MITGNIEKKQRGAPKKLVKKKRTNITLEPSIKRLGEKIAFEHNKSMSSLFEDMILDMAKTLKKKSNEGRS